MNTDRSNHEQGVKATAMNRAERATVSACAEALLPQGGAIPLSAQEAGVLGYFDSMLARLPATTRFLIRLLLRFVEFSPLVYGPFKARMSKLPVEDRIKVIRSLSYSRIYLLRTAFVALRTVLTIAYFGNHEVNRAVGLHSEGAAA